MMVDGEQRPMPRGLVRPVPGKPTLTLGGQHPCELGDQGRAAIG